MSEGLRVPLTEELLKDPDIVKLRSAGYRITQPRIGMVEAMQKSTGAQTIEEIHKALTVEADLVTVYRSIEALERAGVVRRGFQVDGVVVFEYIRDQPREFEMMSRTTLSRRKLPPELNQQLSELLAIAETTLSAQGAKHIASSLQFFED